METSKGFSGEKRHIQNGVFFRQRENQQPGMIAWPVWAAKMKIK